MKVTVVDYDMGNVDSVVRAVEECGGTAILSNNARTLEESTRIILPGVGSFASGMASICSRGLDRSLSENVLERHIPILGICLGMQLLGKTGYEGGKTAGLGWIDGEVRRLVPNGGGERIPHVGWNTVNFLCDSPLTRSIPSGKDFYFVHSYVLTCDDAKNVVGKTEYCGWFPAIVSKGHIFGVQFHPEKSQRFGLQLLKNFLST